MNHLNAKSEFSNRIVIFAIVTIVFSLIACIIHVNDVRDTYLERHQDAYFDEVTIVKQSMQSQVEYIDANAEGMSEHIAMRYDTLSESELNYIISTYQDMTEYWYIVFEDVNGDILYVNESPNYISEQNEILVLENGNIIKGAMAEEDGLISTFFSIDQQVWQAGHYRGNLTCYFKTAEMFDDSTLDFLTSEGFSYITDFQNITLSLSEHSEEHMGAAITFQEIFETTFGSSEDTAKFYHKLYAEIDKNKNGVKYITAENGQEYLLAYQLLSEENETYLITYYDLEPVLDNIHDMVFRTSLTCIFIISLMLILIMFVWLSSMKTTSLIEKMAYEDPITKGKNLNYFKVKSQEILKTYGAFSYLVERYDIANFRYINEAYGRERADELLKGCLRLADEVFLESELCARMDSDQFILLSVNDSSTDIRWARYKQGVNEYARTIGIKYPIRFKVGIYQIRETDDDINMIIDRANAARKLIDSDSHEMTVVYSDSILDEMRRVDYIESDMMRALHEGEFQVYLQQKYNIEKNMVCGAEALIRWIKPDGRVILPGEFIPLFEKNGFIEHLDYYVLETVCAKQRELINIGKEPVPISVNQSKVLLNNPDYVRNVERIYKRYKIPKKLVILEVTESVFLNDEEAIEGIIQELKELGIAISMDDFGKGYSSLNLLKNLSFDILKIDRGFVSDSLVSEKSRWILRKIIEMAYGLGMSIVCEGIETEEQLENVRKMGGYVIQGFYFGKPIPMSEFIEKYIKEKNSELSD